MGINNNSNNPFNLNEKYNNTIEMRDDSEEGSELIITHNIDDHQIHFRNYFWEKKTYEDAFRKNGLKIQWLKINPMPEGVEKFGQSFWNEFLEKPFFIIIRAEKSSLFS